MDLISVVIPVYQVEKYLKACVVSVQNQTYRNLEIILVDDGSKDDSPAICDELAQQDDRIVVIHKVNEGAAEARNVGISAAKGKYIVFVDSDDAVDYAMIDALYNTLKSNGTKISACGYKRCNKQKQICEGNSNAASYVCNSADFLYDTRSLFPWGKLYDIRLFAHKRFVKGQRYEDIYLIPQIVMDSNQIAVVKDRPLYFYTQREDSAMGMAKSVVGEDYAKNLFFMELYAKRKYGEESVDYQKVFAFCIICLCNRLSLVSDRKYYKSKEYIRVMKQMIIGEQRNIISTPFLSVEEKRACFVSAISVNTGMKLWIKQKNMKMSNNK